MMFGTRSNGKQHGVVFTRESVVNVMLDLLGYRADLDLRSVSVIEPAAGEGAFAMPMIQRLYASSVKFQFDFEAALENIHLYEIDPKSNLKLSTNLNLLLNKLGCEKDKVMVLQEDFLKSGGGEKVNFVVGNPPYVRYDNIPKELQRAYRQNFKTFRHRADLYVPFFEKGLESLKMGGRLVFLCANRWMKSAYGEHLRALLSDEYCLEKIIDLTNTNPFQEKVTAYPAIAIVSNQKALDAATFYQIAELKELEAIVTGEKKVTELIDLKQNAGNWFAVGVQEDYRCALTSLDAQGFHVGIGVATGCDRLFIRDDFRHVVEDELLLPIISSKDLRKNKLAWKGTQLLNPYTNSGDLISLSDYPLARLYLEKNSETLKKRYVARKQPSQWFRTIDKVKPNLMYQDKILLPDISGNSRIFIDEGNYYPHHNLYYITGGELAQLKVLAAILMSDFVHRQLGRIGNKMNGGYVRWQSQNLRRLVLPPIQSIPTTIFHGLLQAYTMDNCEEINRLVADLLAMDLALPSKGQMALF